MNEQAILKHGFTLVLLLGWLDMIQAQTSDSMQRERRKIIVTSSIDKTNQPAYLYLPPATTAKKKLPVVVLLHTWSNDFEQRFEPLEKQVAARGWLMLEPNFRGRNDHPEACGSNLAQQDVLDALAWVKKNYPVDTRRIYLVGFSGGGYFTMLMAALHPRYWAAASAWCGISDLTEWYIYHEKDHYGEMMRQVFGGAPSKSDSIALQYRRRSPLMYLARSTKVPLDIAAGKNDSIVPPYNSVSAFNTLVQASGYSIIDKTDIDRALAPVTNNGKPDMLIEDSVLGRHIFLRKQKGKHRLTIFDGVHEWVPAAAMQWVERYYNKKKLYGPNLRKRNR